MIPSLPGYFLSTLPSRDGWSLKNTARVFHALMTDVLGYKVYAGHGGDWVRSYLLIAPFSSMGDITVLPGLAHITRHGISVPD